MQREARKAHAEAEAQQYRCELVQTRDEQLRRRIEARWLNAAQ
jgi:hypothetical protein